MTLPLLGRQQTVGRFEVRDFLGRGAIGDVLLSWDPREERLVALKVIRTAKTDPEMLEAEKSGLSLQAQLATVAPQVAAVYEQGQDGEFFWVAMEYVAGTDLSQLLTHGALPEQRAIAIALELVSMLEVCHDFSAVIGGRRIHGIVHGDIKPENIRLQQREGGDGEDREGEDGPGDHGDGDRDDRGGPVQETDRDLDPRPPAELATYRRPAGEPHLDLPLHSPPSPVGADGPPTAGPDLDGPAPAEPDLGDLEGPAAPAGLGSDQPAHDEPDADQPTQIGVDPDEPGHAESDPEASALAGPAPDHPAHAWPSPERRLDHVRVLDFGIAKHLSQTRRFTVNLFGSLPYTPPERLERGVVDRHSDLWAVGVVLATMVSGRRPFPGNTPEELEQAIRHGVPPLPLPAGCSPELSHVVDKSLAFEVGRRYQTAGELKTDLLALRDGRPLPGAATAGPASDLHATRRTMRPLSPDEVRSAEATRRTDRVTGPLGLAATGAGAALGETGRTAANGGAAAAALGPAGALRAPAPPYTGAFFPAVDRGLPAPTSPAAASGTAAAAPATAATAPDAATAPGAPTPPTTTPARRPRRVLRRLAILLLTVALFAIGASQLWAWNQAKQLRRDLAEVHPDLDAIAQRYDQASPWCWLSTDLFGVGDELQRSLTASAARIIDSYHGDDPTTSQHGWETAYRYLHDAVQIAPRDRAVRARMLYTRAHLDRIESLAWRGKGDRKQALASTRDAVAEFQDASRLDPNWPDPYLGLARIYAYDLFDLDALQKTLDELTHRGYQLGRREKAMLADAFRMQGLALETRAQRTHGDGEVDLLKQARDDLEQAVRLYGEIPGFAAAASNREEAESHLEAITARLSREHPAGFWERLGHVLSRELRSHPGGGGG